VDTVSVVEAELYVIRFVMSTQKSHWRIFNLPCEEGRRRQFELSPSRRGGNDPVTLGFDVSDVDDLTARMSDGHTSTSPADFPAIQSVHVGSFSMIASADNRPNFGRVKYGGAGGNRTHLTDLARVRRLPLEHATPNCGAS